jgi:outer membrane protein assembly factor BamB
VECVDAATGKTLTKTELPKNRNAYSASPVIVDGRVIVTREDGESSVLELPVQTAAERKDEIKEWKVLGQGVVDEMTVATPVCVDGRIFLRTHDSLWCLGEKE